MKDFITVDKISVGEYSEKHSRFIATLYPCSSQEEASEILSAHKAKYFDARHNVYAYILSDNTTRFSDDGEPHGTAAKPMLDVLSHSKIVDALLIVTRYFGGILLGTGGLVRAYSAAAKQAIENAECKIMVNCSVFELNVPYSLNDYAMSLFSSIDCDILNTDFGETVTLNIAVPTQEVPSFLKKINEMSSSKITPTHKFDKILPKTVRKQRSF